MQDKCSDVKCPIHGAVKVRGNVFVGRVISAKAPKTVIIERELIRYNKKYERFKKIKSKIYAYNPACINAKESDVVRVGETRKLSRTKSFAVLAIEGKKEEFKGEEGPVGETPKQKSKEKKGGEE